MDDLKEKTFTHSQHTYIQPQTTTTTPPYLDNALSSMQA